MSYTQGPWKFEPATPDTQDSIIAPTNFVFEGEVFFHEDGQLLASAPHLLEALKACLPLVDAYRRLSGGDGDTVAMNARYAITRATGEQA